MVTASKPNLLDVLNGYSADDLAALDEQIAEHDREGDALKAARKIISVRINGKPPRGTAAAKRAAADGDDEESLRNRIHDYLTELGEPAKPGTIGADLGIAATKVGRLTNHEWFAKTPDGVAIA